MLNRLFNLRSSESSIFEINVPLIFRDQHPVDLKATMEKYMNRFKMNKEGGLKVHLGGHHRGFTKRSISNNAARVAEKQKAVQKEAASNQNTPTSSATGRRSAAIRSTCRAPGLLRSTRRTPDEAGRGQIQTPANSADEQASRMRKGGFYLDGTKDTRK